MTTLSKPFPVAALTLLVLLVGVMAACGGDPRDPNLHGKNISKSDYGVDWPLTVEEARLWCKGKDSVGIVWVHTGGIAYPLNGTAKGGLGTKYFASRGFKTQAISRIWRGNGISQFDLIGEGLALCRG